MKPSVPTAEVQGLYVNLTAVIYNFLPCTWAIG